jgi:hypothetical protein
MTAEHDSHISHNASSDSASDTLGTTSARPIGVDTHTRTHTRTHTLMSALEVKHDLKVENKFVFLDDSEEEEPDTRSATAKKKAKKKAKAQAKLESAATGGAAKPSAAAEPSAIDTSATFIDPVRDYVFDDEQESALLADFELPSDQKKKMRKKEKEVVAPVTAAKDSKAGKDSKDFKDSKGDKPSASTPSVTPALASAPVTVPAPVATVVPTSPSVPPAAVAFNPNPTFENKELLTKALIEMGYQSAQISMALFSAVLQPGFTSVRAREERTVFIDSVEWWRLPALAQHRKGQNKWSCVFTLNFLSFDLNSSLFRSCLCKNKARHCCPSLVRCACGCVARAAHAPVLSLVIPHIVCS